MLGAKTQGLTSNVATLSTSPTHGMIGALDLDTSSGFTHFDFLEEPMNKNPLIEISSLPHQAIPFQEVKTEHFLPALEHFLKLARERIAKIKTSEANFMNSVDALECVSEESEWVATIFYNLLGTESNDELQALAQKIGPMLAEFSSDLSLDPVLFEKVKAVHESRSGLKLNQEQNQLLENTYKDFVRNGARLDEAKKERLRAIDQRLSQLGPKFSENVLKSTNHFELILSDTSELAGLPEGAIEAAAQAAEAKGKKGKWLFSLHAPSIIPFMKFSQNRKAREVLATAMGRRAFQDEFDNQAIVLETVKLRHERALLLGYENHAHFVLEKRMAETPAKVKEFLEELLEPSLKAARKDVDEVRNLARELDGIDELKSWDFAYYSEKLKEKLFAFNEEDLRPYFKLENVIKGVFAVANELFDLELEESKNYPVYHPEVHVYEVWQSRQGKREFMGLLYADYFPRDTKRDGAWMTNFYEQGRFRGQVRRPHVGIVCNFTKPTATKPSLLNFGEVQTLFHEFGHALHSLLSRCHYRSLSGTNVYWDFVELPSQILENWTQHKEALDLFAHHFKTDATMPHDLIEKIKASDKFQAGYNSLRQLSFGLIDMAWFGQDPKHIQNVAEFEEKIAERTRILPRIPHTNTSCAFGHIFGGGYSAGYYSYKWAEVLEADAFEFFVEEGIFNPEVARRFEEHILSKGGSEHPSLLYKKFRGRDPDPTALLRREGLQ